MTNISLTARQSLDDIGIAGVLTDQRSRGHHDDQRRAGWPDDNQFSVYFSETRQFVTSTVETGPWPVERGTRLYRATAVIGGATSATDIDIGIYEQGTTLLGTLTIEGGSTYGKLDFEDVELKARSWFSLKIDDAGDGLATRLGGFVFGWSNAGFVPSGGLAFETPDPVRIDIPFEGVLFATESTPFRIRSARTFTRIETELGSNSSTDIDIDVKKNGSTVHSYTHTASQASDSETISEAFAVDDLLTIDITDAGSGGEDLTFHIR